MAVHWRRRAVILSAIMVTAACTNPYEKFYQPKAITDNAGPRAPSTPPRIAALSSNPEQDIAAMARQGYAVIGISGFAGIASDTAQAADQARKVGAEVVLVTKTYRDSIPVMDPAATSISTLAYSNGSISATDGMSLQPGVDLSIHHAHGSLDRYDQVAIFFAPLTRTGIGLMVDAASDQQRRLAGDNPVLAIDGVREGSPAAAAGILPGDLLLAVGGQAVTDPQAFKAFVMGLPEGPLDIAVLRSGQRLVKHLRTTGAW